MLNFKFMGSGFGVRFSHIIWRLEILFTGPQGRNIINLHLSRYLETGVSAFSFFT